MPQLGFSPELALSTLGQLSPGQLGCLKARISGIQGLEFDQAFVDVIKRKSKFTLTQDLFRVAV